MVPGGTEISLNCRNSRNVCCREEQFSVFYSTSQGPSNHVIFPLKLEQLNNTVL